MPATFHLSHLQLIASISPKGLSPAHLSHSTKPEPAPAEHSSAEGHVLCAHNAGRDSGRKSVIPVKDTGDPWSLCPSSSIKNIKQNHTKQEARAFNPVIHRARGCREAVGLKPMFTSCQAQRRLVSNKALKSCSVESLHLFLAAALEAA